MDIGVVAQFLVELDYNWILHNVSSNGVRIVKRVTHAKETSSVIQIPIPTIIISNLAIEGEFFLPMVKFFLQTFSNIFNGRVITLSLHDRPSDT